MKKTGVLGVTTLAGALLFTGVGHQAHAAQTVNDSNVQDYAKNAIGSKYTEAGDVTVAGKADGGIKDKGNYYEVTFSGEKDNGINRAKVYKDGRVVGRTPRMGPDEKEIVFAEGQNQNTQNQSKSEVVGTDEDGKPQQNNNKQTQATDNNATTQNNTQSQAQVLPETGKTEVNSGLVTSIAAILLAVGSLLTFKRFSKEK